MTRMELTETEDMIITESALKMAEHLRELNLAVLIHLMNLSVRRRKR